MVAKSKKSSNKFTSQRLFSQCLLQASLASILAMECSAAPLGDQVPGVNVEWEKCYGIAKMGENDCSSLNGSHLCSSKSLADNDPNEYIWVPKDSCSRIVNGTSFESKKSKQKAIVNWCKKKIKKHT